jgi:uncharacterized membrane protein
MNTTLTMFFILPVNKDQAYCNHSVFKNWLIFELIGCKMIKIQTQIISEELMENQPMMEATSDDKLWALLAYVLTPIVPIIILLMEDKKNRPFIRAHNAQALAWGLINLVGGTILSSLLFFCFGLPSILLWAVGVYWGIQAYNGKMVEIPVITNFVKQQGWA